MRVRVIALAVLGASSVALARAGTAPPAGSPGPGGAPASDVRSLGARGDGVADDTAAIQAACARGGSVLLPPGTYAVSSAIALSGRVRIDGPGATIVSSDPTGALFKASGDLAGLVVRDVVLRTTRKDLAKRGEALLSVDYHSLDGALLENVTFDTGSSYQNGISLAAELGTRVENVTIRDCAFSGASAGVELVHHVDAERRISSVKILNSRFVHNGLKDDQYAGFAISLSGPLSRIEVAGNDIRGYPYAGVEIAAPRTGAFEADYVIHANTIADTGRGIVTDTGSERPLGRIRRVSISGNVVVGNRFFQRLQGLADSVVQGNVFETRHAAPSPDHQEDFFSFYECERILVAGNAFRLELPPAEAPRARVAFAGVRDSHVTGNRFESSGQHVVVVGSTQRPSPGNSLSGNRFVQRENGPRSTPVAFEGASTKGNVLSGSVVVTRHDRAVSSQTAANVTTATTVVRPDTGEARAVAAPAAP